MVTHIGEKGSKKQCKKLSQQRYTKVYGRKAERNPFQESDELKFG